LYVSKLFSAPASSTLDMNLLFFKKASYQPAVVPMLAEGRNCKKCN
jgi:hypothetical protein